MSTFELQPMLKWPVNDFSNYRFKPVVRQCARTKQVHTLACPSVLKTAQFWMTDL